MVYKTDNTFSQIIYFSVPLNTAFHVLGYKVLIIDLIPEL